MNNIVSADSLNFNVYLFPSYYYEDTVNLSPYDVMANPYDTAWLFFIDQMPNYGWAHPCMYVFIRKSNGNYTIKNESMPPLFYWLEWEEVSVPFPECSLPLLTPGPSGPSSRKGASPL